MDINQNDWLSITVGELLQQLLHDGKITLEKYAEGAELLNMSKRIIGDNSLSGFEYIQLNEFLHNLK